MSSDAAAPEPVFAPERCQALVAGDSVFRSCHDTRLTEEDLQQARLELGETEDGRRAGLRDLRSRLIGDGDFRYRLDDAYLLRFLRYQKFDAGRAHASLRSFYALRSEMPQLFALPDGLESLLRSGLVKCLPYRSEQGSIVFWIDSHRWRVSEMSFWDTLVLAHAFADVVSQNPSCQVNGVVGLWDLGGLSAAHLPRGPQDLCQVHAGDLPVEGEARVRSELQRRGPRRLRGLPIPPQEEGGRQGDAAGVGVERAAPIPESQDPPRGVRRRHRGLPLRHHPHRARQPALHRVRALLRAAVAGDRPTSTCYKRTNIASTSFASLLQMIQIVTIDDE